MSASLPPGCLAAPVNPADHGAPLRLCAVLRSRAGKEGSPTAAHGNDALVPLGDWTDAAGFLGCVRDAGGRVREWLEWRVQLPPDDPDETALTDERWRRHAAALTGLAPDDVLATGWETTRPAPMLLDPAGGEPAVTTASTTATSAASADTVETVADTGLSANLIPFNPFGGMVLARRFVPLDYEGFADALGGKSWPGLVHGRGVFPLPGVYEALRHIEEPERAGDGGHLFGARRGWAARLAETFHLKVHLLLGAARAVRGFVAATGAPMLNVSSESFRVALAEPGAGLPFLWTARVVLARPGDAEALPLLSDDPTGRGGTRYFRLGRATGSPSLYRPAEFGRAAGGRGTVRLRKVSSPGPGPDLLTVEGTLVADENLPTVASDLLRLRLRVNDTVRVDLFGHLDAEAGLATGETRFRTLPQRFPDPVTAAALTAAAGGTFAGVPFETVPMLGSPCDLYALGVLGVRTLLVNDANTLAEALDETLSLARQVGGTGDDTAVPLETRLETLAREDPRWAEALGPGRLLRGGLLAAAAAVGGGENGAVGTTTATTSTVELLPSGPWWAALAALVRCFCGVGPDATCRDAGDAPTAAPEAAFDRLILDLETLARRTRGLVLLGDVALNREVRAAIRQFAAS